MPDKGRGLCPRCGARRMHDVATHFVERVLPEVPIRPYVLPPHAAEFVPAESTGPPWRQQPLALAS